MASSKKYLDFVLEQLSGLEEITYRAMMGEYILYYRGKIAGGIYDDRLLVKPVYNQVIYEYETPAGENYRITYHRKNDISRQNFIDLLPGAVRLLAKLVGFEGSYLRFEGSATVERLENGNTVESCTEDSAVWELMYFGKSGADKA